MTTQQAADRSGLPELDVTTEDFQLAARLDSTFASHLAILKCRERQLLAALKRIQVQELPPLHRPRPVKIKRPAK